MRLQTRARNENPARVSFKPSYVVPRCLDTDSLMLLTVLPSHNDTDLDDHCRFPWLRNVESPVERVCAPPPSCVLAHYKVTRNVAVLVPASR